MNRLKISFSVAKARSRSLRLRAIKGLRRRRRNKSKLYGIASIQSLMFQSYDEDRMIRGRMLVDTLVQGNLHTNTQIGSGVPVSVVGEFQYDQLTLDAENLDTEKSHCEKSY